MSVTTRADEKLREAKEYISKAIENLHEVNYPETWGNDEFKKEYLEKFIETEYQLKMLLLNLE